MHIETFKAKKINARRVALIFLSCTLFNAFFAFELGFEEAQEVVNLPLAMPTLSLIQASNSASESPRNDSERMILGSAAELTGSLGWGFDAV